MMKMTETPGTALIPLLDKYQLNPYSLSKATGVNYQTIRKLIIGKAKVSIPTALKLAKFFKTTPKYWLYLQIDKDLREAEIDNEIQLALDKLASAGNPAPSAVKAKKAAKPSSVKPAAKAKKTAKPSNAKPAVKTAAKKAPLSDKRKAAAKVPGAKPARGK